MEPVIYGENIIYAILEILLFVLLGCCNWSIKMFDMYQWTSMGQQTWGLLFIKVMNRQTTHLTTRGPVPSSKRALIPIQLAIQELVDVTF